MAQSRIQPEDLASFLAAYKNTGAADAINAGSQGVQNGVNLANTLAMKKLEQQKIQADMLDKAQQRILEAKKAATEQQKVDQNSIPVQTPETLGQLQPKGNGVGLPANAPTASYDPTADQVTPNTITSKMSPEAFKVQNPDIETKYKQAAAQAAKTGQPIDPLLQKNFDLYRASQTPETYSVAAVGTTPETKGKAKLLGSKNSEIRTVDLGAGFDVPQTLNGEARKEANDIRKQQFDENKLQKFAESAGGLSAGGKSAVGIAAKGNLNIDRALATLSDPNMTPQALGGVIGDTASLYSGGAATLEGLKSQEYNTLQNKIAQLKTLVTSQPQALNQPEIKAEIADRLNEIKSINNQLLERNVGIEAAGISAVLERNPKAYQRIIDSVSNAREPMTTPNPVPTAHPVASKVTAFPDADKEARYQAWKAAQPKGH